MHNWGVQECFEVKIMSATNVSSDQFVYEENPFIISFLIVINLSTKRMLTLLSCLNFVSCA